MALFFFKQKKAYEIKECDWSSDVCSSDLGKKLMEVHIPIERSQMVPLSFYPVEVHADHTILDRKSVV